MSKPASHHPDRRRDHVDAAEQKPEEVSKSAHGSRVGLKERREITDRFRADVSSRFTEERRGEWARGRNGCGYSRGKRSIRAADGRMVVDSCVNLVPKSVQRGTLCDTNKVGRAIAVRRPEALKRHRCIGKGPDDAPPGALAALRVVRVPDSVERRRGAQVVNVPVPSAVAPSVALDASVESAGTEGAPDVDVRAGTDGHGAEGPDLNVSLRFAPEQKRVGAGRVGHRAEVVVSSIVQNAMPPACCPTSTEATRSFDCRSNTSTAPGSPPTPSAETKA